MKKNSILKRERLLAKHEKSSIYEDEDEDEESVIHDGMTQGAGASETMPTPVHTELDLYNAFSTTIIIVVMIIKNFVGDGEQLNISGTVRLRGQVRGGIQGGDCLRWVAQLPTVSQFSQVRVVGQGSKNFFSVYSIFTSKI